MKPRPTPKSLRAGQTLYVIHPSGTMVFGVVHGSVLHLDNAFVADLRKDPGFPWQWTFYSRRQAHSAAQRECQRRRAIWHEKFVEALGERFAALPEKFVSQMMAQQPILKLPARPVPEAFL